MYCDVFMNHCVYGEQKRMEIQKCDVILSNIKWKCMTTVRLNSVVVRRSGVWKKNFQGISQEVFQQKVYWECVNSLDSLKAKTQHSWIHKSQGSLINSGTKSHFCSVIWQWTLTLMQKFHCFCHSTICCRGSKQLHFNNLLLGIGSTSFSIDWTVLFFAELSTLSLNVISYY